MNNFHIYLNTSNWIDVTIDLEHEGADLLRCITSSHIFLRGRNTDASDKSASFRKSLDSLHRAVNSAPNANERLLAILTTCHKCSVKTHTHGRHVVRVALCRRVHLLPASLGSLSTTEVSLRHIHVVEDNTKSSSGVNRLTVSVECSILSCLFTPVTVHPVDNKLLVRRLFNWLWMILWFFDGA